MGYSNQFFEAIGVDSNSRSDLKKVVKDTGIPLARLKYYNQKNILPTGKDLESLETVLSVSELELQLKMGRLDHNVLNSIQKNAEKLKELIQDDYEQDKESLALGSIKLAFETKFGKMYEGDCLRLMSELPSDSVDLVFADPPFNLDKLYPSKMDDNIRVEKYLEWSEAWISECIRILKPGGAFFTWNLPFWNSKFTNFINSRLNFKHWITADIKFSLPIKGRLYPSHYSLLYYVNGDKPNFFNADRMSMQTCPKCFGDLKDYGGYKHKMNPKGVSLTDVWLDISPVRHAKYKNRGANELSLKLLDRIIEMASKEGDTLFDPFGGAGTTYVVAEIKKRKWIGVELGPVDVILKRIEELPIETENLNKIRANYNNLFPDKIKKEREKRKIWTCDTLKKNGKNI